MEEWIKVAGQLGVPVALLALLIWKGWPFFQEQVKEAQASHRNLEEKLVALSDKFAETMRGRDVMMAEIQERNLKALENLAAKIDGAKTVRAKTIKTKRK